MKPRGRVTPFAIREDVSAYDTLTDMIKAAHTGYLHGLYKILACEDMYNELEDHKHCDKMIDKRGQKYLTVHTPYGSVDVYKGSEK